MVFKISLIYDAQIIYYFAYWFLNSTLYLIFVCSFFNSLIFRCSLLCGFLRFLKLDLNFAWQKYMIWSHICPWICFDLFYRVFLSVSDKDDVYLISVDISRAIPHIFSPGTLLKECIWNNQFILHAKLYQPLSSFIFS